MAEQLGAWTALRYPKSGTRQLHPGSNVAINLSYKCCVVIECYGHGIREIICEDALEGRAFECPFVEVVTTIVRSQHEFL